MRDSSFKSLNELAIISLKYFAYSLGHDFDNKSTSLDAYGRNLAQTAALWEAGLVVTGILTRLTLFFVSDGKFSDDFRKAWLERWRINIYSAEEMLPIVDGAIVA